MQEICRELSPAQRDEYGSGSRRLSLHGAIVQIMLLDIVSSLDSVITAVGLSRHVSIMIAVVMITAGVMMFAAKTTDDFVSAMPSVKILALTSLSFIDVLLVADSLNVHVTEEYLYFVMFFSLSAETLDTIRERRELRY